jgi:hypothetical protein
VGQLITDDGTLNGVPWGRVNYHSDDCSHLSDHWHVVWQLGDELRRAYIRSRFADDHWHSPTTDLFSELCLAADAVGRPYPNNPYWDEQSATEAMQMEEQYVGPDFRAFDVGLRLPGTFGTFGQISAQQHRLVYDAVHIEWRRQDLEGARRRAEEGRADWTQLAAADYEKAQAAPEALNEFLEQHGPVAPIITAMIGEHADEEARRRRNRELRTRIADLPQLFIAD